MGEFDVAVLDQGAVRCCRGFAGRRARRRWRALGSEYRIGSWSRRVTWRSHYQRRTAMAEEVRGENHKFRMRIEEDAR